jgi:hypothetical protein
MIEQKNPKRKLNYHGTLTAIIGKMMVITNYHTCWLIRELPQEPKEVWTVSRTLFLLSKIKPEAWFFPLPDTPVKELVWKDLQKNI